MVERFPLIFVQNFDLNVNRLDIEIIYVPKF